MTVATFAGNGDGALEKALRLFSGTLARLEEAGLVVRDFPRANDANIWIFGYLLDGVRDAARPRRLERRRYDHAPMLRQLLEHLRWSGHALACDVVEARLAAASSAVVPTEEHERWHLRAHMRRQLSFAREVVEEMAGKGLLPAHEDISVLRRGHEDAVRPADTPPAFLTTREIVEDIAREVEGFSAAAASDVRRFSKWKPSICR